MYMAMIVFLLHFYQHCLKSICIFKAVLETNLKSSINVFSVFYMLYGKVHHLNIHAINVASNCNKICDVPISFVVLFAILQFMFLLQNWLPTDFNKSFDNPISCNNNSGFFFAKLVATKLYFEIIQIFMLNV